MSRPDFHDHHKLFIAQSLDVGHPVIPGSLPSQAASPAWLTSSTVFPRIGVARSFQGTLKWKREKRWFKVRPPPAAMFYFWELPDFSSMGTSLTSGHRRERMTLGSWVPPKLSCGHSRLHAKPATLKIPLEEPWSPGPSHTHLVPKPWCDIWNQNESGDRNQCVLIVSLPNRLVSGFAQELGGILNPISSPLFVAWLRGLCWYLQEEKAEKPRLSLHREEGVCFLFKIINTSDDQSLPSFHWGF